MFPKLKIWFLEEENNCFKMASGFPAVAMAKAVGERGETFPAVFNAANEQAVYAFHREEISLPDIIGVIAHVVDAHTPQSMSLEAVLEAERWAREIAEGVISAQRS